MSFLDEIAPPGFAPDFWPSSMPGEGDCWVVLHSDRLLVDYDYDVRSFPDRASACRAAWLYWAHALIGEQIVWRESSLRGEVWRIATIPEVEGGPESPWIEVFRDECRLIEPDRPATADTVIEDLDEALVRLACLIMANLGGLT